jgi:mono/diheme cytochrome c family protein
MGMNHQLSWGGKMARSKFRFLSSLVALGLGLAFGAATTNADDAAALYKAKCAGCHAADGSGNSPAGKAMSVPDLRSADIQKKTDAQLIDSTTNGKGKMPAYKGKLTDDQIKSLVTYVHTLAKP